MPLRKLAAALDIDTSTLSKIERQERQATSNMVPVLADVFGLDPGKLQVRFLTEKIYEELCQEEYIVEALEAVLAKLRTKPVKT